MDGEKVSIRPILLIWQNHHFMLLHAAAAWW